MARVGSDKYRNRAYFFSPSGEIGFQDKLQLIEDEKSPGLIERGDAQTLFATSLGKVGIAVCYDSEFPELVRSLALAGADIILVPSYTVSSAGYHRVLLSGRARAIENQCYVAMSFVTGEVALSEPTEQTVGCAAIVGPADTHFPDNGILAQAEGDVAQVVSAELSLEALQRVREYGAVRNFHDSQQYQLAFDPKIFNC